MKDIKELAERIAKDFSSPDGENNEVIYSQHSPEFAQRLIAAYTEGQEPFAWGIEISGEPTDVWLNKDNLEREFNRRQDKYPDATRRFVPLYAAPPLTEPAPAVDPHWPNINMDISEKSAAQLQDQVENLAALVNRLCRQVNRFDSGNKVAVAASKYICDNDLIGTSLRKDDEGIQKIIDMVKENSND